MMPNAQRVTVRCDIKSRGRDVFDMVVAHANLVEHFYFGLAFMDGNVNFVTVWQLFSKSPAFMWFNDLMLLHVIFRLDDEFFFLNHDTKISKVAPDCWKKLASSTFTLFLRVKFFADDVSYIL